MFLSVSLSLSQINEKNFLKKKILIIKNRQKTYGEKAMKGYQFQHILKDPIVSIIKVTQYWYMENWKILNAYKLERKKKNRFDLHLI